MTLRTLVFCIALLCSGLAKAQENIRLRSYVDYRDIVSSIWGYTDSSGKEYALVGVSTGLSIVDISDPDRPLQRFFIPSDTSIWREIKTWSHYAYVTNEKGSGLMIVDLASLPASISFHYYTGDTGEIKTAHTIFIDENGYAYLNGCNAVNNRGTLILDLNTNPWNPSRAGAYTEAYVHDAFARGDTLFTCEIYEGRFSMIDIRDKNNPLVFARQQTPLRFTHNGWKSDDGNFFFTTDERPNAPITAYDVSDPGNIKELDSYRSHQGDSTIPHNTVYRNGYLINAHYRDGVTIVDAHNPENLIETGHYDTSPFPPGSGYEGCWGVYPFFNSGLIIASDRQEGLFVLEPNYIRACYLEGAVRSGSSSFPLSDVKVEIMGASKQTVSRLDGSFRSGTSAPGNYDVRFTRNQCFTKIISGISLNTGAVTSLDVRMDCERAVGISELNTDQFLKLNYEGSFPVLSYQVEEPKEGMQLSVWDINGRRKTSWEITTSKGIIEFRNMVPGTYIAVLEGTNEKRKFVVY